MSLRCIRMRALPIPIAAISNTFVGDRVCVMRGRRESKDSIQTGTGVLRGDKKGPSMLYLLFHYYLGLGHCTYTYEKYTAPMI